MSGFIKHVGKHGDRKVAIVYRTVPGEEHMALVIYPETLSQAFHDSVMKVIEGDVAQSSDSLADAMHRSLLADGRNMLGTLHSERKLKKVQTNQIVVTPNAKSHVRLDELNKILDGIATGGDAAEKMANLDKNACLVDPSSNRAQHLPIDETADMEQLDSAVAQQVLDDATIAKQQLEQSKQMAAEAKALVAESKRLEKEAFKLDPALKPKRAPRKKAAAKTS